MDKKNMNKNMNLIWSALFLLLLTTEAYSNVVFTSTPANPSPPATPLTFSWIDDCELITLDYGDGSSDTNPATFANTITHTYAVAGEYFVQITGNVCSTAGTQDFITVFIQGGAPGPGPGPAPGPATPTQVNIERLQLYFDNRLPKTTVARNEASLQAHASIRYSGSGLLQAFWEVDGRIIERIDRHLLVGGTLQLSTPKHVQLPTFITGPHRIRLVITSPAISPASLPEAVYFVTPQDKFASTPELISPSSNSMNSSMDDVEFRWSNATQAPLYLLQIFSADSDEKVFSAYAKKQQYRLKQSLLQTFLQDDQRYDWQVISLDDNGTILSTSERNSLSLNKQAWAVDHQFMLIVDDSLLGHSVKQKMIDEYQLDVIEEFSLSSLSQAVVVFQTERESNQLLNDLLRKKGVIGAQPDYIYRNMASHAATSDLNDDNESLQDLQSLSSLFDFNRVHQQMSGEGSSVAIIDTGVEVNHPDLIEADINKLNFIKGDSYQDEIHGTAIAGIIAAQRNRTGIIGLAPDVKILAFRACRQLQPGVSSAECYSSSLAKALDRAIKARSQLVNFSFGTPAVDPLVNNLLNHGVAQGILLIAAAGNDSRQQELSFPASHKNVLSVAGRNGERLFPSKLLADKADIRAPSEQVFTTVSGGKHNFLNGTSMSSAIASGIVSLALSQSAATELNLNQNSVDFCVWVNGLLKFEACKGPQ